LIKNRASLLKPYFLLHLFDGGLVTAQTINNMKKLYTFIGALAILCSAQAQRVSKVHDFKSNLREASAHELNSSRELGENQVYLERGGDFFLEEFSNGIDGDTPFGAWTMEDSGGNTIWMVADANSPAGEFSTNIGALNSTSAANGWMIFDCDGYNTPISAGVEDVTGFLTSPVIDMSALETVLIEWEQYFRYCCYPTAPITLEVTNDGGDTWTSFAAHGDFFESANEASANPQVTSLDISCAAAGESAVQIRFAYNNPLEAGYSHYYWGIDDVRIFENTLSNNLEAQQVTNGDIYNIWEYRVTPLEQAITEADGGLLVGTIYRNNGIENQEDILITVEILDSAQTTVLNTTVSESFSLASYPNAETCPPKLSDTLYMSTGWEPTDLGFYWVRTTIESTSMVDDTPENNTIQKMIEYSTDEYGHDDENALDTELEPRDNDDDPGFYDPTGYGCYITVPNTGSTCYGMTVRFGDNTEPGYEFYATLYLVDDAGLNDSFAQLTSFWVTEEDYGQGIDDHHEIYFPFDGSLELDPAETYFVGILEENGVEGAITVMAQANTDNDNSTAIYERAGDQSMIWFGNQTATPAIRAIISERTGIDDLADLNGLQLMQNIPNPALDQTTISYKVETPRAVSFEIYDLSGKLIEKHEMGTVSSGEHTFTLNTSNLSSGVYSYTMVSNGVRLTKKMIISGK